jgi:hypothetical protein
MNYNYIVFIAFTYNQESKMRADKGELMGGWSTHNKRSNGGEIIGHQRGGGLHPTP